MPVPVDPFVLLFDFFFRVLRIEAHAVHDPAINADERLFTGWSALEAPEAPPALCFAFGSTSDHLFGFGGRYGSEADFAVVALDRMQAGLVHEPWTLAGQSARAEGDPWQWSFSAGTARPSEAGLRPPSRNGKGCGLPAAASRS